MFSFNNEKRKKKFLKTMLFLGIFVLASMIWICVSVQNENEALLKNGIKQDVVVIQTYNSGTRKNPSYSMDVAFFTKAEEIPLYTKKDTTNLSNAEKFSNEVLSQTFGDKSKFKLNNYKTFHIDYINGNSYNTYKKGDVITLIYLKNKPEKGRVFKEIE